VSVGTGLVSVGLEKLGSKLASAATGAIDDVTAIRRGKGKVFHPDGDIYFTSKMHGKRLAYSTHGGSDGTLMNQAGVHVRPEEVAAEIAHEIARVVPPPAPNEPLVLIACYGANGGQNSPAQVLANHLNRPVTGFRGPIGDVPVAELEMPKGSYFIEADGHLEVNKIVKYGLAEEQAIARARQLGQTPRMKSATEYRFMPSNWDWEAFPNG
jgi:hypothetical protein